MGRPIFIIELKADFSLDDCVDFLNALTENGEKKFRNLYVSLPFLRLKEINAAFPNSGITFGASMINSADPGAFTAPVAGLMTKDAGGVFTLIGTSYERNFLKLSDEQLLNKLKESKRTGLKVIYAIGAKKDIDKETAIEQLKLLKESNVWENDSHPTLIYELSPQFQDYFPSEQELKDALHFIKEAIEEIFGEEATQVTTLVGLPSDLIGFSNLVEGLPFDGAFFTKSGAYPHSIHNETVKLIHVHCDESE